MYPNMHNCAGGVHHPERGDQRPTEPLFMLLSQRTAQRWESRYPCRQFTVDDFMDEEELQEKGRKVVETSMGYDTFGHAASEQARSAALKDQPHRTGLPTVDLTDIIAPVLDSVGTSLLSTGLLHHTYCLMWISLTS